MTGPNSASVLDVLAVAKPDDAHADLVCSSLVAAGARVARLSLNTWRSVGVFWELGGPLTLGVADEVVAVTPATKVWWRRPGTPIVDDLELEEGQLAGAEAYALLLGTLLAVNPCWVDTPSATELAEVKLHQLAVASRVGIAVPRTVVTNDPKQATRLASLGPVVAKAVSSGPGAAPYAAVVPNVDLASVEVSPTMLQAAVSAQADVRIVTIGQAAFTWVRERVAGERSIDWRANDPEGMRFVPAHSPKVEADAIRLATCLGLSFSVQDWLQTNEGHVFLEVNPQGNWLFLAGADSTVLPQLVAHLLTHG